MDTSIHMPTHTGMSIFTLHMCIHFASIGQMVKFKPVGVLKWWKHYKECLLNIYEDILHMRANTVPVMQCSSFKTTITLLSFYKPTYVNCKKNTFPRECYTHQSFSKNSPKTLWSCKTKSSTADTHSTSSICYSFIFSSNSTQNTETQYTNAFKHFHLPLSSPFVNIKADFILTQSVLVREEAGNLSEPIIRWRSDYDLYCVSEGCRLIYVLLIFLLRSQPGRDVAGL